MPVAEDLTPPRLRRLSLPEFLDALPSADPEWRVRVARATGRSRVLRYVVVATPRSVQVRLLSLPADGPIGSLRGTRNLVSFTTVRYQEPLVITGPGAGTVVTAAGILNDIQQLAASLEGAPTPIG